MIGEARVGLRYQHLIPVQHERVTDVTHGAWKRVGVKELPLPTVTCRVNSPAERCHATN